ncbi:purple acid phosphatase 22-like [Andrographis paniculata]|uniref:purple acid phosphatase 22-like n=1 Tax=Andrographis paniculata TaxID=175694 RepID=UPI0021E844A1|nr:purple acid phosphatase 22-like [Andrographis paniculata]
METFLLIFYLITTAAASPEYTRPSPRALVTRRYDGSDSDPQQVHISLVGKDGMRISWITKDDKVKSVVDYGTSPGKYTATATGDGTSYRYFLYKSGKIHHVKIGPLQPSTTYYYRCGAQGGEFSFRTPPSGFPVEFAVAGDLGQTEWTESTLSHIGGQDYDVFLLPGDLSYADTQQHLWDSYGLLVEPYARSRPWMVTEGNHEIERFPIVYPEGFRAYNARWVMPYEESGSKSNLYYSFEVAGVHVMMLGSYTDFESGSAQYGWVQEDLGRVNRSRTPWILALIHAPWYNSNRAHRGEGESMRKALEETLYKAKVDLVFAGHVHAYERFGRVYDNKADKCGPVHITIGDGGNREGLASSFDDPSPSISLYREPSFGHGRLRVFNATHALWSWHRNNETNAAVADQVWLENLSSSCLGTKPSSKSRNDEL